MQKTIKNILLGITGLSLFGLSIGGLALGIEVNNKLNQISKVSSHEVKLYSTNDMHGRIEGSSFSQTAGIHSIAGFLQTKQYDLLLDAGDMIQGQALNDVDKGKTMAKIASTMEYDAIAVGNHEFDFGIENIKAIDALPGVNLLSANTRYKVKDNQGNNTNEAGERVFEASKIVTLDSGLKAGIIGLTTLRTTFQTHPDNVKDLVFTDLIDETEKEIEKLEKQGINFIIVVSHVGASRNSQTGSTVQLAEALNDKIDLIVDGHSQVDYNQPVISDKGVTQIIQTGEYTKSIRETDFIFDEKTGTIKNFKSVQIPYDEIKNYEVLANPQVKKDIDALKTLEGEINNEVIIEMAPIETQKGFDGYGESPMGSMVSDSNLWASRSTENEELWADVAFINVGGVRASLPQDKLLRRNVFEVLPFGNQLRIAEMPGRVLKQTIDFAISRQRSGAFLQFSDSIEINVDATMLSPESGFPPLMDKTKPFDVRVKIKDENGIFQDLDLNKTYRAATNDFILAGGDNYTMLNLNDPEVAKDVKVVAEQGDMLLSLIDFIRYLDSSEVLRTQWATKYAIDKAPERIIFNHRD